MAKDLFVIAGPNGAGKTTFAEEYVARHGDPYIGADAIAEEMSPDDPSAVRGAAGREFFRRIDAALSGGDSFIVESTLSGRTFERRIDHAKHAGFRVTIIYLFLYSADNCVDRVKERVQKGGHDVPEVDVRRRFVRSVLNFWNRYRTLADHWVLVYNSTSESLDVAVGDANHVSIRDAALFSQFQNLIAEVE